MRMNMINSTYRRGKLEYVGSIVLGLNDALWSLRVRLQGLPLPFKTLS